MSSFGLRSILSLFSAKNIAAGFVTAIAGLWTWNTLQDLAIERARRNRVPTHRPQTVVVLGGGLAGLTAIVGLRKLDKYSKIILVDPKNYMEIHWAAYRSPFEAWARDQSLVPLDKFCKDHNVLHVRGVVKKLTLTEAILENGIVIRFDVCTVATGARAKWRGLGRGPRPMELEYRAKELKQIGDDLITADSIYVIGGGMIGTELAGDIAHYTAKAEKKPEITLVHAKSALCDPPMNPGASAKLKEQLEALGVTVMLNETAKSQKDGSLIFVPSGKVVRKDVNRKTRVVLATGFQPINSMLSSIPGSLDEKGWIQTDSYFCIRASNGRLFAMGDCTTTLPNAGNQVLHNINVIGYNLKATLDRQLNDEEALSNSLWRVKTAMEVYVTTVGPNQGVFDCGWFWTQYLVPGFKNKSLFLSRPKDILGIK